MLFQPPMNQSNPANERVEQSTFHSKPFEDDTKEDQTRSEAMEPSNSSSQLDASSSWDVEEDWGTDDWAKQPKTDASSVSVASKNKDREAKKAELLKKREERKQQREQTARDRKPKVGALKLGVKKVSKNAQE